MSTLITDNETVINKQDYILKETAEFYTRLYTSEKTDNSPQGEIILDEVRSTINSFANDKSPGCDGLTAEFYQTFFGLIGNDLVDVINYALVNKKLTLTMRRGIIVLIWKGNEREY